MVASHTTPVALVVLAAAVAAAVEVPPAAVGAGIGAARSGRECNVAAAAAAVVTKSAPAVVPSCTGLDDTRVVWSRLGTAGNA